MDRIPVGARFSPPIQTSPKPQSASYKNGTVSAPVVKREGRDVGNPSPSSTEVKERVELCMYPTSRPLWPV